jgi:hypothetical protein
MKKFFIALSLMLFVGSMSATAFAASTGTSIELVKHDDKKKKKKKGACAEGEKSCSKKEGEKKACCSHGSTEKK